MNKTLVFLALGLLALAGPASPVDLRIGFVLGSRSVSDTDIQTVYGPGVVYFPSVGLALGYGFEAGAGFEGGYSKDGLIGPYQEETTLKVSGWEIYFGREFAWGGVRPYLRLGWGFYSYEQDILSDFLAGFHVDDQKQTVVVAGGLRYFPTRRLFLCGEVKYVPLKVSPYDIEVDLGGWRFMAGLGLSFSL